MPMLLEFADAPKKLVIEPRMTDEAFEQLCFLNANLPLERTKEGAIVVNAPAGFDSDAGNAEVIYQLKAWSKQHGRGIVSGATAGFFLPDGSSLSPDAAYLTQEQVDGLRPGDRKRFLRTMPAFVIELRSRTDALSAAQAKMRQWIGNGVQLAWLINPPKRTVLIYEVAKEVAVERGSTVRGFGPVDGFVLDLEPVWELCEE